MWNAYERLFDGNSVNWFFFVHAACVPPCSVYLLYSSWPHQPFNSAQCNTSATGPIEQTSRYQRKSLCVPKLLCQMRAFMISSDIFCFEITLSKQITDTFASIYIRHSHTHTRILLAVRHLVWELLKWFQMNERRFDPLQLIVYTFTHTPYWCIIIRFIHAFYFQWTAYTKYLRHFLLRPMSKYFTRDIIFCSSSR